MQRRLAERIFDYNTILRIVLLFPLTTLFQSYIEKINQFLIIVLTSALILLFWKNGIKKKEFLQVIIVLLATIFEIIETNVIPYQINDIFYLPLMVIYYICMSNCPISGREFVYKNRTYIKFVVLTWNTVVFLSFFLSSSYKYDYVSGGRYFSSFTSSPFRLAPTALFILILVYLMYVTYRKRKYIIWGLPSFMCFFMGGSRTYLAVALMLFVIIYYSFFFKKKVGFWLTILPIGVIISLLIMQSSVGDKIISAFTDTSNSYYGAWAKITNSRNVFWSAEIAAFNQGDLLSKLFGYGFNFVYDVNLKAVQSRIWAHNDFLQLLLSYGMLGLVIYFVSIKKVIGGFSESLKKNKLICSCVLIIWLFNAFFNMFYTYFCSMLSFPFLLMAIESLMEDNGE